MLKSSTYAALTALTLCATAAHPSSAGDNQMEMAEVTFAFQFFVDPYADADQDGVPDPLPEPLDMLFDNLNVIVVGGEEEVGDNLVFKDLAMPSGPFAHLSGTTWYGDSFARIVQHGRPQKSKVLFEQGVAHPAIYRTAILPSDILYSDACWIKVDSGTGHMVVQEEYDFNTTAAVVFVTAEVRVK